ncbi:60S acidic ribosomal protein P0, putative [Plasmodium chabaudi chabaudi]|uniref:60S acidic ribosomal protein P0 n=2 Tax=Plasmodium chabaudi TaxID=5825 RepID=A0A077XF25_PLACU|nr:60S acidic ribosomal protein P0, putative [Plasmodium chabaudi chabaudi]SCM21265.1 60S acidic ribosomal protein P0, putative [Plasmodium chabaudi adami]SCM22387.1 60S acidic ribosomal protein P0, putative [Plasmodium chabaudi chabaudi]SCN60579.1 60S acidic ribosomal protein P0, putative [Plasmodium chabaudi chabaudi]SCN60580.1 60S acidic ribosomal protein P0, putative [Plasmodium chabaudi adami]VTZ68890.1 60S acidic ribosomal protein P0, putative [Plasmodium chabaudi chabaudi]|eukprot:XP_741984.2 60S acidic ribosomal protein P0, putative [Plasmodium chabaudi chabaudi]
MAKLSKAQKKQIYMDKLSSLIQQYNKILIVHVDNVGSDQMASVRQSLRGKATILMGKNTRIRTALKKNLQAVPQIEKLLPLVKLNMGFVFCKDDLSEVRSIILQNKSPAPARLGVIAPIDVFIPPGPTGMDPSHTSFFQSLGISTKIVKGQIEIQENVHLIKQGEKVTASSATLLQKFNMKPFSYGVDVRTVYDDGVIYDAKVLDITEEDILAKFSKGVANVAALSRSVGIITEASYPHVFVEAFKNIVALVIDTDYTFPMMQKIKDMVENPQAYAAAPAAASSAPKDEPKKEEAKKEEEEEDEEDGFMGFGMFD